MCRVRCVECRDVSQYMSRTSPRAHSTDHSSSTTASTRAQSSNASGGSARARVRVSPPPAPSLHPRPPPLPHPLRGTESALPPRTPLGGHKGPVSRRRKDNKNEDLAKLSCVNGEETRRRPRGDPPRRWLSCLGDRSVCAMCFTAAAPSRRLAQTHHKRFQAEVVCAALR